MCLFKRRSKRRKRVSSNDAVYKQRREMWDYIIKEYGEDSEAARSAKFHGEGFRCECNRDTCAEQLDISLDDYPTIRSVATHFVVHAGHEDGEAVVSRTDGVVVVFASTSGD